MRRRWGARLGFLERHASVLVVALCVAAFVLRWVEAGRTHLHPDEAHQLHLALPSGFAELARGSTEVHHPPLIFFLLNGMLRISFSEVALRFPMVLSGALLPWAYFCWLRRISSPIAGMTGAAVLAFSPTMLALSSQVRAYVPAMLFSVFALLFFDLALERRSKLYMILFAVGLWAAVLSEYSAAWFCAGAGVYALLHFRESRPDTGLITLWAISQVAVIGIYATLYSTAMQPQISSESRMLLAGDYLREQFPLPGQSLSAYIVAGTLNQLAYLFYTRIAALPMIVLSGYGVWLLVRSARGAVAALCVVPFLPACLAGWWFYFPYGRSRHTVILSLFLVTGISVAFDRLLRSRAGWMAAFATPPVVTLFVWLAAPALIRLHQSVQRRDAMIEAIAHLRRTVPRGPVLADRKTALVLSYYLCGKKMQSPVSTLTFTELDACGYLVVAGEWSNSSVDVLKKYIPEFRRRYPSSEKLARNTEPGRLGASASPSRTGEPAGPVRATEVQPVWVVDAGFDTSVLERIRESPGSLSIANARQFDGAVAIFQVVE